MNLMDNTRPTLAQEIREWIRRVRAEGLTRAQAMARFRGIHKDVKLKRGDQAASEWWAELERQLKAEKGQET